MPGEINVLINKFIKRPILNLNEAITISRQIINTNNFFNLIIFHEYFHFLFENGKSGEDFKMIKNPTEFNSYSKELMLQLFLNNNNKKFDNFEQLKFAYENFNDIFNVKKNLLKINSDEDFILKTLKNYNDEFPLKEDHSCFFTEEDFEIFKKTLNVKPSHVTRFSDLENLIKKIEENFKMPIEDFSEKFLGIKK